MVLEKSIHKMDAWLSIKVYVGYIVMVNLCTSYASSILQEVVPIQGLQLITAP